VTAWFRPVTSANADAEASLYHRRQINILIENGDEKNCWVYECNPNIYACRKVIASGDWIEYLKHRPKNPQDGLLSEDAIY